MATVDSILEIDNTVSSTTNEIDKILLIPLLQHDIILCNALSQHSGKVSPSTVLHTRNEGA